MQYPGSCGCGMEPGGHVSSGTHWLDDAAPVSSVCLPPGHAWHAVFPDFEVGSGATAYFETGHATQARCRCATAAGLKRPAPHTWHVSMPKPFDDKPYPAAHAAWAAVVNTSAVVLSVGAGVVVAWAHDAPAGVLVVPWGHRLHATEPGESANRPVAHAVQAARPVRSVT